MLHQSADEIPVPPDEFRELVNGLPIDESGHREIGGILFDLIRNECQLTLGSTVLDIGCGCGRIAAPMTEYLKSGTYHGLDIVEPMIAWCRQHITSRHNNFHFRHANLTNTLYNSEGTPASAYVFPFNNDTFDVIFATSVFTHLVPNSAAQYARQIHRVLKPGGKALLTWYLLNNNWREKIKSDQTISAFPHPYNGCRVMVAEDPERVIAFEIDDAIKILLDAGLKLEKLSLGAWSKNQSGLTWQDVTLVTK
jgi:SAM-dependent methyltransferase